MFGIFTHAQLGHRRFWDSLGQQLQQRGPGYIQRCTFRNTGDNAILPAMFFPLPYSAQDTPQTVQPAEVSEEGMESASEEDTESASEGDTENASEEDMEPTSEEDMENASEEDMENVSGIGG